MRVRHLAHQSWTDAGTPGVRFADVPGEQPLGAARVQPHAIVAHAEELADATPPAESASPDSCFTTSK
ncbi:hypothetical protein AB0G15_25165 [Streptosporangium sp. NPDC023825]|uniref:hypothetical protein n=1 Tax=Streptosporangium sp. NPDC023825 TaxID=3154909 RepID=UPI00341CBF29